MILSDTVKMKEYLDDPEMHMDLMYRIAKGIMIIVSDPDPDRYAFLALWSEYVFFKFIGSIIPVYC